MLCGEHQGHEFLPHSREGGNPVHHALPLPSSGGDCAQFDESC